MESKVTVVIVGLLGAVATLLSFAAEFKRTKASDVYMTDAGCVFPTSTALEVAIGAAVALLLSQIIISSQTGCFTSKYAKLPIDWSAAKRNSFICRSAFGIGFVLLITAISITRSSKCIVVKPGIFAAAGLFSLISVAFGILFYLSLSGGIEASNTNINNPQAANYPPPQAVYPPPQTVYPPPQAGYPPPQTVYPPPQTTNGIYYGVEQPQIPTNKPY